MANSDCTFQRYFEELFEACWEQSGKNTEEIFGAKEVLPEDELELVFSPAFQKLSQADKLKALRDHRARTIEGWN